MVDVTTVAVQSGLRARKKNKTRQALLKAAWWLFEREGFDGTTIDAIAHRAEVSRRTVFRYFATKEEMVFPEHEARLKRLQAWLDDGQPGYPNVKRAVLALADEYAAESAHLLAQYQMVQTSTVLQNMERKLDEQWERALSAALTESDSPTARRRAHWTAGAMMGATRATLRDWFQKGAVDDLPKLGRQALRLLEQGIS